MTDNVPSNPTDSGTRLAISTSGLAPAPLIAGEDTSAYDDLLARLSGTLKPSDVLDAIDVITLTSGKFPQEPNRSQNELRYFGQNEANSLGRPLGFGVPRLRRTFSGQGRSEDAELL